MALPGSSWRLEIIMRISPGKSWHGPYTISRKINEVIYEIKDNIGGELRLVSVQQVVRYLRIESRKGKHLEEWRSIAILR